MGVILSVPLSRSVLLSLHLSPALAAVWALGWQAGPPIHLSVALILWRAGRLDPWWAAAFFGNTTASTTLAGILAHNLVGPLRPDPSWTESLAFPGCGTLACVLNTVVFLVGRWLDKEPLSPDQTMTSLAVLLVTALPLSHLMAVAALTSLAAYALMVMVWVVMGLAIKWLAEGHEARERLQEATQELRELAGTDPLTGLQNRRRFLEVFQGEVLRHARDGTRLSVLVLDVRGLKQVNDLRGHPAGDELLQQVASTLRGRLRSTDGTFRIGGDEFAVLFAEHRPRWGRYRCPRAPHRPRVEGHRDHRRGRHLPPAWETSGGPLVRSGPGPLRGEGGGRWRGHRACQISSSTGTSHRLMNVSRSFRTQVSSIRTPIPSSG